MLNVTRRQKSGWWSKENKVISPLVTLNSRAVNNKFEGFLKSVGFYTSVSTFAFEDNVYRTICYLLEIGE